MRKFFAAVLVMVANTVWGVDAPTPSLKIGDLAPPLRVMKWLKGEPVERFEPGRIYIVEFWATWCGPCIAQMPHLSELAKKYTDRVSIIGISVREGQSSNVDVEYVQRFVDGKGDKMGYTVAMDNPQTNTVFNQWVTAVGLYGIPVSFIVDQNGRIAWVGFPGKLDRPLVQVIDGTLNPDLASTELREYLAREVPAMAIKKALQRKDYAAAWTEAQAQMHRDPRREVDLFWMMLTARLHVDAQEALEYFEARSKDADFLKKLGFIGGRALENLWNSFADIVSNQQDLSANVYTVAADHLETGLRNNARGYYWWSVLAKLRVHLNDYDAAIVAQEKAVASLDAMTGEEANGYKDARVEMKERLASYREKKK